jgi:hypothetical protein
VLADDGGLAELRRLGARSVPVVSRGNRFVFAQVIGDVVDFLALDEQTGPALSPAELHVRYDHILETAIRLLRQMPDDRLEDQLQLLALVMGSPLLAGHPLCVGYCSTELKTTSGLTGIRRRSSGRRSCPTHWPQREAGSTPAAGDFGTMLDCRVVYRS